MSKNYIIMAETEPVSPSPEQNNIEVMFTPLDTAVRIVGQVIKVPGLILKECFTLGNKIAALVFQRDNSQNQPPTGLPPSN